MKGPGCFIASVLLVSLCLVSFAHPLKADSVSGTAASATQKSSGDQANRLKLNVKRVWLTDDRGRKFESTVTTARKYCDTNGRCRPRGYVLGGPWGHLLPELRPTFASALKAGAAIIFVDSDPYGLGAPSAVDRVKQARKFWSSRLEISPKEIRCVYAQSRAALPLLNLVASEKRTYDRFIGVHPVTRVTDWLDSDTFSRVASEAGLVGSIEELDDVLSPVTRASELRAKFRSALFIGGALDPIALGNLEMVKELQKDRESRIDYILLPGVDHAFNAALFEDKRLVRSLAACVK
jgi:hypothetical protein